MGVTAGTIAAGEQTAHDADKPLFLANNALDKRNATAPKWTVAVNHADPADPDEWLGHWAYASVTLSTHPVARAYDRDLGLVTKPDVATPGKRWALLFDLDDTAGQVIDSVIIAGHNFASLSGTITVQFWVHDLADETVGSGNNVSRWLLGKWTAGQVTKKRLASYKMGADSSLGAFAKASTVRYAQVSVVSDSANIQPEIGEIVVGRRRQLSRKPTVGAPIDKWSSFLSTWKSESGRRAIVEHASGLRQFEGRFRPTGSDSYSLDDVDTIKQLLVDCRYGAKMLSYCPDPKTNAQRSYWCQMDPGDMTLAVEGYVERSWEMQLEEASPSVEDEER